MTQNVRLQNLRDFTVQIRNANDEIVGTGIAVSIDGKIVTCAHVLSSAIGTHPRHAGNAEIGVYFPQARGMEQKKRFATVAKYLTDHDDDIVLLQLTAGPPPLAPEQIPVLGAANGSEGNNFRSYGYRQLQKYVAGLTEGILLGEVETTPDLNLLLPPLQLRSRIGLGMSGAAILDIERNLVVGFISEVWIADKSGNDAEIAWAVNAAVLAFPPFNLQVLGVTTPSAQTRLTSEEASKNRIFSGFKRVRLGESVIDRAATTDQPINKLSDDALGFDTYVRAIRDFIASEETSTPLTISIDSPWGYGKTSLMRMLQNELDPPKSFYQSLRLFWIWLKWSFVYIFTLPIWAIGNLALYLAIRSKTLLKIKLIDYVRAGFQIGKKINNVNAIEGLNRSTIFWAKISAAHIRMYPANHITIWFNAWKFSQEEQLWAALALAVIEQIKEKYNPLTRIFFWLNLTFKRLSVFEAFWTIITKIALPLSLGYIAWIYQLYINQLSGNISGLVNLGGPLLWAGALISGIIQIASLVKDPFQISTEKIFDRPNYKEKLGFLSRFETDFLNIVSVTTKSWGWKSKKLIIFIDDLDRCQPPKAVDIIEAINLFLDSKGCIFVLGMDSRAIIASIETKYKDLIERVKHETLGDISLGHAFLEKIIQIPFRVPYPTSTNIDSLVTKLSLDLGNVPEFPKIEIAETASATSSFPLGNSLDNAAESSVDKPAKIPTVESRIDVASYARVEIQNALAIGARLLENNPRLIKRFTNIFRLFVYIANERGMFSESSSNNNDEGLNPEKLAIWLVWSMRWPRVMDYLMIEEQREGLRLHLAQISQLLNEENNWIDPLHDHANMVTGVTKIRKQQKSIKTHWCHLPWDWWLLNNEFLQCIKGLEGFWRLSESKLDWLIAMFTMTAVRFDFPQTTFGLETTPIIYDTKASLPLRPAPEPKTDELTKQHAVERVQATVARRAVEEKYSWNNAPAVLQEWTGREHLLARITEDWNDPLKYVTSLTGFGGEGKSSLTRKWVDILLNDTSQRQPDGVFWWGFYENHSVDEFLEAALNYMSGGLIDPRAVPSSNLRAQFIGAMRGTGHYLFVLDGLEVLQHQEGDQYGLLKSNDLRDLLTFFARPDNQYFCLITSRASLLDLIDFTTYTHRDVDRLSEEDGRALLRRLGVKGSNAELKEVVTNWDGHALTLSILAAYLSEQYHGDIKHLVDIPVPTTDEPRYERVHRVLRRYDEHLSKEEREFLELFSVFRLPVQESAFEKVFQPLLKSLDKNTLLKLVSRLVSYRIIRHDEHENSYTTHPLIRNHYFALFTKGDPSQEKAAHEQLKDYYLAVAGDTPQFPTLDDLKPLIEVVHHACQAGRYDEAWIIYWARIRQGATRVTVHQLGAYEVEIDLLQEFFPNKDTSQLPLVSDIKRQRFLINAVGYSLMNLGHLFDAVPFFERYVQGNLEAQDWHNASIGNQNLAELYAQLGMLEHSRRSAIQALEFARRAENKGNESLSLGHLARTAHLLGETDLANENFRQGEILERRIYASSDYLSRVRGINYTDHLRQVGNTEYAYRVATANLDLCRSNHWTSLVAMCHRVIGDLDSYTRTHDAAREHYESALKIARSISHRPALIEALLAHGRWQAKHMKDANVAFNDLNEALGYCVESGYRIYEADVRVALAWAYLANGEEQQTKQSAERALQMSNEMGYHWGKVDAQEVLNVIARSGEESKPTRSAKPIKTKKESKPINKRRGNLK